MSGVYVHIPFCRKICSYCDFYHTAALTALPTVVENIERELEQRHDYIATPDTLYFGGGTPSVLSGEQVLAMVEKVKMLWQDVDLQEVTFEANPDDLTPDYINALRKAGINRLSIGIQSFDNEHLRLMNRRHTGEQAIRAVRDAQKAGFENITIDLIYGLPFMTAGQWQNNLDMALSLDIQHISAYHLTIEPLTVFGKQKMEPVEQDISQLHFDMLRKTLCSNGFEHYEVSNFAREGFRSLHNSNYWNGTPYLGVGPSAHSYNGTSRQWNPNSLKNQTPEMEILTPTDIRNEQIMTRLRTADGLLATEQEIKRAAKFLNNGSMILENGLLKILPEKFLISDYIISELFD